jgi:hypothetical protein
VLGERPGVVRRPVPQPTTDDRRRLTGGVTEQGGIWGYTLCGECNSATGRLYGTEYQGWAVRAAKIFAGLPPRREIDRNPSPFGAEVQFGSESDGGVAPGAFVRQVLSCMCTLSCSWDLAEQHPAVRRIVLEQATEPLPDGLHLGMALYAGPDSRMSGPQLRIDVEADSWEWALEMAHPPFAFKMVLATNADEPYIGLDLAPLTLRIPAVVLCSVPSCSSGSVGPLTRVTTGPRQLSVGMT